MCGNSIGLKKIQILVILAIWPILYVSGQMIYPIVGTYEGKNAQGMAVWDNNAYLFNDGGHCRVVDLESGLLIKEFDLASSKIKPHINNACFGVEMVGDSKLPVIYVSETNTKPQRCFVEDISGGEPILLQTIYAQERGKVYTNHNWVVDREKSYLYGINRKWHDYLDSRGNVNNIITKYRLPKLREGSFVTLSETDMIDRFEVIFANGMQDAIIKNNLLYISTGLHEMAQAQLGAKRAIIVIDLKKKKIRKVIDLSYVTTNEPEGIDFWRNKCLIFCGQNGGLYQVKLK